MGISRRDTFKLGAALAGYAASSSTAIASGHSSRSLSNCVTTQWQKGFENTRKADLGDGTYLNPVFSGDRPDPSILKDGDDYYLTYSAIEYYPAMSIWHSKDMINWQPVGPALTKVLGTVYAPHLTKHNGKYYIYLSIVNHVPPKGWSEYAYKKPLNVLSFHVIQADNIEGPWSEPVDMEIYGGIDPEHVVDDDGKRYLIWDRGYCVQLNDEGTKAVGKPEKVYHGWEYPNEWPDEGFCLEGPKILKRNGWYYAFAAQGGTAGPPTAHMVVVSRAKSIMGPWEHAPNNPIIRTQHRSEKWWSRGHATAIEGPNGDWWLVYHGYENGYQTLGRHTLIEPMAWSEDGWPIALGDDLSRPIKMPVVRKSSQHNMPYSGAFTATDLGMKFSFFKPKKDYMKRVKFEGGSLTLEGQGTVPGDSSPLAFNVGDHSYELTVKVQLEGQVKGGLVAFYDEGLYTGVTPSEKEIFHFTLGRPFPEITAKSTLGDSFYIKLLNEHNVVSYFLSEDGKEWVRHTSYEMSGYHHNMKGGFISLRPAMVAVGTGRVHYSDVKYRAL
ncbi:hypothetical protein AltI4_45040 (plasmid) [Alteromonas sp. I4]|nr:hypothetical protein AltI4_45040 [Alteromonas sp. I4]